MEPEEEKDGREGGAERRGAGGRKEEREGDKETGSGGGAKDKAARKREPEEKSMQKSG